MNRLFCDGQIGESAHGAKNLSFLAKPSGTSDHCSGYASTQGETQRLRESVLDQISAKSSIA